MATERFVPALGRHALTPLYDATMALTMRERAFRPAVVAELLRSPRPARVLDVGAGTGTLAAALAAAAPEVEGVGVEPDPAMRERAARKGVRLLDGMADALPLPDASFDAATATLVLHHLSVEAKARALRELRRVVRPGGRVVVADWGRPAGPLSRVAFRSVQLLDGAETTRSHLDGIVERLARETGYADVAVLRRWRTAFGTLELLAARA
jgi:ubiquinone/menaquinone biosynthesis C-methylase UbiE